MSWEREKRGPWRAVVAWWKEWLRPRLRMLRVRTRALDTVALQSVICVVLIREPPAGIDTLRLRCEMLHCTVSIISIFFYYSSIVCDLTTK